MATLPKPLSPPPPPATQQDEQRAAASRARVFGVVVLLLFALLVARLWFLQIAQGDDFKRAADANKARRIRTRPPRGIVTDRNGVLLAASRSRFAVYVTPDVLQDPRTLSRLAALIGQTPADIVTTVSGAQTNPYDPVRVALDVPVQTVARVEENRPFLPGVSTAPEPVRWYPGGTLAAHLLGTMGRINGNEWHRLKPAGYFADDFLGKTGLEKQYENVLRGTPGGTDVQIDAHGRKVRTVDTASALPGATLTLAIDARVQAAAEAVFKAHEWTGAAAAIDPRTGAVLALVSAPTYNPNAFSVGISGKNWKPLMANKAHPLIDRACDAMYPPGSTFKPVIAAAGLQTGAITTHSGAYCPGAYYLGRARFGCWSTHGSVNFYSAMAESCDVFFYGAGQRIGPDNMARYAKAFGLAEKTGIDLPHEKMGSIPSPAWKAKRYKKYGPDFSTWFGGDTLHMAIGQGDVLTTPLQMARVAATVANGGDVLRPFLVEKVSDPATGNILSQSVRTTERHVPVSAQNMDAVRRAMRQTVTSGTGKVVNFKEVAVAAKTGSAQVHGNAKTHGLFICFAPYDHPTIAIAAIVEQGGHGGTTAGKVAAAMLGAYFHLKTGTGGTVKSD